MANYGLFVNGKMLGTRQQQKRGGQGYHNEIGIGLELPDGFGGIKQDLIIIRVSQSLVNAGVLNQANALVGKIVQIPIYVRPWSMEGREGVTYNLSSDAVIKETK
ncbi:DNA-binding protein [Pectobacterium parmentieri]|uniref:DNA-binding protein n=4 Tax=Pectobacterium TaxID=122277 RepID=UPI003019D809